MSKSQTNLATGTIVQGDGSSAKAGARASGPRLFLVRDGHRVPIPDARAFRAGGYDPAAVRVVPDLELERLPIAPQRMLAGEELVLDLDSFLGAGHFMTTWGVLRKTAEGAHVDATTRTRTITMFGGFRGAVNMVYSDVAGFPVGMSSTHSFGVDGTWVGRSDRTDFWSEDLPQEWATRVTTLSIFHFWNPNQLGDQIRKLVDATNPIWEIVDKIQKMGGSGKSSS